MESVGTDNWRTTWFYRLVVLGFLVLLAVPVFSRPTGDWENVYLGAAKNLRSGADLLANGTSYVYPPFGALFAVPFTFLPRTLGLAAWALLNVLAAIVILACAWRMTGGRALPGQAGTSQVDHAAFWLGGLCAVGFMLDTAANWQSDLVIAALLVGGCALLAKGRGIAAGVAFGIAAAFKCTPLLFAPYLLWKRQFVAAVVVLAVAVGLNVLPDFAYPPPDGQSRLVVWKERFLVPMANKDRDIGVWASAVGYNHSLVGVNLRWLAFERVQVNGQLVTLPRQDRMTSDQLKKLNLVLAALLGLVALAAVWRRPEGTMAESALAAEFGIVFTLMLLLSPMSSKPHFGILLLPQLVLVRAGWVHRDRLLLVLAGLTAVGGLCTGKDIIGRKAYDFLLWNGLIFWMTTALFLGCCHARYWYRQSTEAVAREEPATTSELERKAA
jgi:alpha-1,2-mannosyltransferase